MLIERIGHQSIVELRKPQLFAVIDRDTRDVEYFSSEDAARLFAIERADLVDGLAALVH